MGRGELIPAFAHISGDVFYESKRDKLSDKSLSMLIVDTRDADNSYIDLFIGYARLFQLFYVNLE